MRRTIRKTRKTHKIRKNKKKVQRFTKCGGAEGENQSESACKYISSTGFQLASDVVNTLPTSDYSIVYCKADLLGKAQDNWPFLDKIDKKYILVIGQSDYSPSEIFGDRYDKYVNDSKCIHVFSQNCDIIDHKITHIPIGLDYHTLKGKSCGWGPQQTPKQQDAELQSVKDSSLPFHERKLQCYANFDRGHISQKRHGQGRINSINKIPQELLYFQESALPRLDIWKAQSQYAFVISPHGNGLDCHRTWEALCLGCITIVRESPLDPLYDELPVLIVKEWSDVTKELLETTVNTFKDKKFNYDKLLMSYWVNKIHSYKKH